MKKGDILTGAQTKHPIIYLKYLNNDEFAGCIITHASNKKYSTNIKFNSEHFEIIDINKKIFKIQFENSFFVNFSIIKKNDWGPFNIEGKLTNAGIMYLEANLKNSNPLFWKDYISKKNSHNGNIHN